MRRKSVLLVLGITLLLLGGVAVGLVLLLWHEPQFYRDKAVAPGQNRKQLSNAFQQAFFRLSGDIYNGREDWHATFSEAQLNSYFEEHFIQSGVAEKMLPDGVTAPRVGLEPDVIRLAFRYGQPPWSTIISIDLRVWLVQKEVNVIAVELRGLHAGAVPITAQSLLEQISEMARRKNIDVTWYRHEGYPVALLRFLSDRPRPSAQLQQLKLGDGVLSIAGRSLEPGGAQVMTPPASVSPHAN